MADVKCKKCNRLIGEKNEGHIKLNGQGVSRVFISENHPAKFNCRSCSTEYKIINQEIVIDNKSTSRTILDNFSKNERRAKSS